MTRVALRVEIDVLDATSEREALGMLDGALTDISENVRGYERDQIEDDLLDAVEVGIERARQELARAALFGPVVVVPAAGDRADPRLTADELAQLSVEQLVAKVLGLRCDLAEDAEEIAYWRGRTATITAEGQRFEAEASSLRELLAARDAIIGGRTTPPTDEELAVHPDLARDLMDADEAEMVRDVMRPMHAYTWWAIEAYGAPCAWPVVDGGAR